MYLVQFMFQCINKPYCQENTIWCRYNENKNQMRVVKKTSFPYTKDEKIFVQNTISTSDIMVFRWGQRGGLGWALPPSLGKLYTLQPFSWLGSLDKVRIVCQQAVMPGMLSACSRCEWVSITLYFVSSAAVWVCSDTPQLLDWTQLKQKILLLSCRLFWYSTHTSTTSNYPTLCLPLPQ